MKRNFAIVTDSASDLPASYFKEHEVDCVPLGFLLDGVTYGGEDGAEMDVKEFYSKIRGGSMPTTFQISPEQAAKHIEAHLKEGKDVLVLAFSSGLSGTANSFFLAAHDLAGKYPERKIFVVDTLSASLGEGLLVDYVVKKADGGATIEETKLFAENLKQHICHYFTVDDLFHLKRGGRVSATTAVIGSMLKIKPVLHVDHEGHLIPIGKARGRKRAITELVERMKELQILEEGDPIFISHGDCEEDVEYLKGLLRENFGERKVEVNCIGSVIGAHSGPGTLAVFFRGKRR